MSNPARNGLSVLSLGFIKTGRGTAQEIRKLSPLQGFGPKSAATAWDSKNCTLISVFRAKLDGRGRCLFASTKRDGCEGNYLSSRARQLPGEWTSQLQSTLSQSMGALNARSVGRGWGNVNRPTHNAQRRGRTRAWLRFHSLL